uniref:Ubiquitin-like protease family profile domain-containing protein n=1 Tax=viral metagenome TaxID=1070528 RepID=A0A6C0D9C2_9ZZZZ
MDTKKEKCAPHIKYTEGSCFTLESLKLIANKYNKINKASQIKITDNKKELVNRLTDAFSKSCDSQTCWLRLDVVKSLNNEDINDNTFRPTGPNKKYEWLSTTHINDVVSQYEDLYKDFVFLGAVPYDFQELPILGLSNINFDDFIKDGKTKLGMVINLDTHDQNGSHWVALYTDLVKNKLYFFDSFGKKPGKRIKKFNNHILNYMYKKKYNNELDFSKVLKMISSLDKKTSMKYYKQVNEKLNGFDIRYNNIQHQQANSECGVYSINFILRLAKGETFDSITKNITLDDEVNKCRKVYFRNT